jgi:hypothetical protein
VAAHIVQCGDHGAYKDPEEEWQVTGFPSAEAAAEYARRFTRAQVEDLRPQAGGDAEALRGMYYRWGEYALAPGLDHRAWVEFCIANPASRRQDTDYDTLEPGGGAQA